MNGPDGLRGAIFDLDGTLVDSETLYAESDAGFLAGLGVDPKSLSEGEFVGLGTLAFLTEMAERFPDSPLAAIPLEERVARKDEAYLEYARGKIRPFPGTVALAVELARRGLIMAIASGSSPVVIREELQALGPEKDLFAFAMSASEVPRGKPAPDIFLEAAKRLGLPPESCLVVEDSRYGVVAAKRAGMACLALPSEAARGMPEFALADLVSPIGALDLAAVLTDLEALGLKPGL